MKLKIGRKIKCIVSEPWDFKSSKGKNMISGIICDYTFTKYGDAYLLKSDEVFTIESLQVQYMVMTYRHKEIDPEGFNIYYIPDDKVSQFQNVDNIEEYLVFIIIGSVQ